MRRRVVVTGLGCITPLGSEVSTVWDSLIAGRSGAGKITSFDASSFPVRIAAEVRDWSMADIGESDDEWKDHAPQTRFAFGAAVKAAHAAYLTSASLDPRMMGVYLGCGEVFPEFGPFVESISHSLADGSLDVGRFMSEYAKAIQPSSELNLEPGAAVGAICGRMNAQGPSVNFTNACVSSATAIGEALEIIRDGDADLMLAGGAHSMIHPLGISGFHRLSTLSVRNDDPRAASRPFDKDRDGFVAGEGATVAVLEELEHAKRRGASILAEVSGYGSTHDAFRITDPRPDGRAAARCMRFAAADARISLDDIDYINAHGSGTVINDKVETEAIKRAFGKRAYDISVSSTKSMTGHLTTACGAIEFLVCVLATKHGVVPPTINYDTPDPECDLDYVPNQARELECKHVLNNNLGFGGHNVSLVVSRFDD